MSETEESTLDRLRRDFDATFAEPALAQDRVKQDPLLVIRAGGQKFALRQRDVAGILPERRVIPVLGADALLGVSGVRGEIVSVFSLTELLGAPRSSTPPSQSWLALLRGDRRVALGFDQFDAYRDIAESETTIQPAGPSAPPFVAEVAQRPGGTPRWIIDAGLVLAHIRKDRAPQGERGESDEG